MSKTLKFRGKTYRVIQSGEHFDGKHLFDAGGNKVKGSVIDVEKAATYEALEAKPKPARKLKMKGGR